MGWPLLVEATNRTSSVIYRPLRWLVRVLSHHEYKLLQLRSISFVEQHKYFSDFFFKTPIFLDYFLGSIGKDGITELPYACPSLITHERFEKFNDTSYVCYATRLRSNFVFLNILT
jgi:hypothetical protein